MSTQAAWSIKSNSYDNNTRKAESPQGSEESDVKSGGYGDSR